MATATASDTFATNSITSSNTSSDLLSTPATKKNQHTHHRSEYPDKTAAAAVSGSKRGIGIGSGGSGTPETVMAETPSPASVSTPMSHAPASRSAHRAAASAQAAASDTSPRGSPGEEEEESSLHSDVLAAFEYSGSTNTSDNMADSMAPAQAATSMASAQASAASINTINTAATAGTSQLAGLRILSGLSSTSPETIASGTGAKGIRRQQADGTGACSTNIRTRAKLTMPSYGYEQYDRRTVDSTLLSGVHGRQRRYERNIEKVK